jgi:hypothetical protein
MPVDIERFVRSLRTNACKQSQGLCARYVRLALEAGGACTAGHPAWAVNWGPKLIEIGFRPVLLEPGASYQPEAGDVVIFQPVREGHPAGHIQAFDGAHWISDFVQRDFWPGPKYRTERPENVVYRFSPPPKSQAEGSPARAG